MTDKKIKIGIVGSEFNYDIVMEMIGLAKEHATFLGAEVTRVIKVPGVYDMALAVKKLLARKDIDGVVTLGAVIEGETDHDEIVIQHAARKITDLALEFNKPVGLGITGPGMTRLQASARIERAKSAVECVVKMHKRLENV
jgi:6,7-dimethyl-8-ribityllumazine synthase